MAEREFRIIAEESVDTPETLRAFWTWAADSVERPLILSPPAAPIVVAEYSKLAEREFRTTAEESVDTPETDKAFWTQSAETVKSAEIVAAEVIFAVPLIVSPDAVTFPADRVTPPITEFAAEIVELIMETPAIELLMVAGVEIDPLVVIVILGEKKFEPVSVHPPMLLVVSVWVVILPL